MISYFTSPQAGKVRVGALITLLAVGLVSTGLFLVGRPGTITAAVFPRPTYSSPITLSNSNALLWVVNPDDASVSVIRTDNETVVAKITLPTLSTFLRPEPWGVAVDPDDTFAYVADANNGGIWVIKINNADPDAWSANLDTSVNGLGFLETGAEPRDLVMSPDGKRLFVANSAQGTVSVVDATTRTLLVNLSLQFSLCNGDSGAEQRRPFQPRGLAVTQNSTRLYVTQFLSFVKDGGVQADDTGKEGAVCRVDIDTASTEFGGYTPAARITMAFQLVAPAFAGAAFPNQLQSIVIRGNRAYLPNVAASPTGPLAFNQSTHAFLSRIDGVNDPGQTDIGALNLHDFARDPLSGPRLFFANVWAVAFTTQSGSGAAYVVSAGSDLLAKLLVDDIGNVSSTDDGDTTVRIDLNDPDDADTSGANAGKNPRGIVINDAGTRAYVMNYVSRNVSVVNLTTDQVIKTVRTTDLPAPGSQDEILLVGAEMFFSSRGFFNNPGGATVPLRDRLSQEGWQNCASCHPEGLTDGVVWAFGSGPRKSVPLNATWSPRNKSEQRVLNYSAIFDEVEDFENNIRNVSGPNNAPATDQPCAFNAANAVDVSNFRVTHGLMYGDDGDANKTICILNAFAKASAGRREFTVTLPGSTEQIPALTAMKEWVRFKVRTPHGPFLFGKVSGEEPARTRLLGGQIFDERCVSCHNGEKWTTSTKNFTSPTTAFSQETNPPPEAGTNPVATQYLNDFLKNIQSFNLGVPSAGNEIPSFPSIGGIEKAQNGQDALGRDYNGDGKGNGYNVPSLLAINYLPPYYHNGACETLACVLADTNHSRIDPGTGSPTLPALSESEVEALVEFVTSIDANTPPKGFRAGRSQPAGTVPLLAPQKAGNRAGAGR